MANQAAAKIIGCPAGSLVGQTLDEWPWQRSDEWQAPWVTTLHSGLALSDQSLQLEGAEDKVQILSVNCASVGGGDEGARGVLVTLDDLTPIEQRNHDLSRALVELRRSQEQITVKNQEPERLARTDPYHHGAARTAEPVHERNQRRVDDRGRIGQPRELERRSGRLGVDGVYAAETTRTAG